MSAQGSISSEASVGAASPNSICKFVAVYVFESSEEGDAPARLVLTEEVFSVSVPKALCHQAVPRRKFLQLHVQM